jgi:hypothetical protein
MDVLTGDGGNGSHNLKRRNIMGTTLARRIRRAGLLPATFIETTEERLQKNAEGAEVVVTVTHRKPAHKREDLSLAELKQRVADIRAAYRVKNLVFREDRRRAHIRSVGTVTAKSGAGLVVSAKAKK